MQHRTTLPAVLIALGLGAGLLGSEALVRGYAWWSPTFGYRLKQADPFAISIEPHGQLGYRQRPNRAFHYGNGTYATSNARGYRGPLVSLEKPPGTVRIVLLGGSTTHGWGVDDANTIDEHMRNVLSQQHPELRIEVVNLAFDGYDSHQLVERLRTDAMPLAPDLIIVNAGINDVRNARFSNLIDPDPRSLIWEDVLRWMREQEARGKPSVWTRAKHYSYAARLPGLARQYVATTQPLAQTTAPNLRAAELFERNLERIVDMASAARIAVLFSTPPSSLREKYQPTTPPERDYWIVDAATTQGVRDELARRMQRVVERAVHRGHPAWYLAHHLPVDQFLDDAHLTADGNRALARAFVQSPAVQRVLQRAASGAPRR